LQPREASFYLAQIAIDKPFILSFNVGDGPWFAWARTGPRLLATHDPEIVVIAAIG
jgi:hypothetical protein